MTFRLKSLEAEDLRLIAERPSKDVIEICKASYDFLINQSNQSSNDERFGLLAKKYETDIKTLRHTFAALIQFMIEATTFNADEQDIKNLHEQTKLKPEILEILAEFLLSKRRFIEGSIKSANLRAHRIVNIEWRLETKIASRCLLKQNNISITMKLYLHTEPKNENRDLLLEGENNIIHTEERQNRKDIIVQTDVNSLLYMIQTLEDALIESRTRRIRNIVDAIN